MSEKIKVAVLGAGGKMGMRVTPNLMEDDRYEVYALETGEAGQKRLAERGIEVHPNEDIIPIADVVVYAVPDRALKDITAEWVPKQKAGSAVVTLDPAAAYANLLYHRDDIDYCACHPTHPSVFLERKTPEEWADTFGGIAAPQYVIAAVQHGNEERIHTEIRDIIAQMFRPTIDVKWCSVHDLAVLEPTLAETIGCMIGAFLKEAMDYTVEVTDMTEDVVEAMFHGHVYIALTNALRGSNPFSDACLLAMEYGREAIIKDDWKRIFNDEDLDVVLAKMLQVDKIER
ncbi:phosphogluconate dehydrogenase C-terminal domain-containing protein [Actinotignum sp. GS-2025a]|uniref:phosphogluconate dehydrogenase C-terminal domain-containing protein n=1 Tax=unclassified Actinotignum TaxID=2632702 RepID=UPI003F48156E